LLIVAFCFKSDALKLEISDFLFETLLFNACILLTDEKLPIERTSRVGELFLKLIS
jgi:hypothetical protein